MAQQRLVPLRGDVTDAQTGRPLPSRVYIQGADGTWHFARSASPKGTAIKYDKQAWASEVSVERHVTLSAHPFVADLSPGDYTITVERGKEYFPETRKVTLGTEPASVTIPLRRWIDMGDRGWYSGDTHVHRTLDELPNVQLAEDLNVTFPLLYWEHAAFASPANNRRAAQTPPKPEPIPIDDTHVIHPMNTEYEIGRVGEKRHTLGAFFVIGHKEVFDLGVPPLTPVAERARREGALLELDKHNWPWSMALVPIMNVDLFELTNNHVWRTEFAFKDFMEREAKACCLRRRSPSTSKL